MVKYLLGLIQRQDKKPSVSVANEYELRELYTGDNHEIFDTLEKSRKLFLTINYQIRWKSHKKLRLIINE